MRCRNRRSSSNVTCQSSTLTARHPRPKHELAPFLLGSPRSPVFIHVDQDLRVDREFHATDRICALVAAPSDDDLLLRVGDTVANRGVQPCANAFGRANRFSRLYVATATMSAPPCVISASAPPLTPTRADPIIMHEAAVRVHRTQLGSAARLVRPSGTSRSFPGRRLTRAHKEPDLGLRADPNVAR